MQKKRALWKPPTAVVKRAFLLPLPVTIRVIMKTGHHRKALRTVIHPKRSQVTLKKAQAAPRPATTLTVVSQSRAAHPRKKASLKFRKCQLTNMNYHLFRRGDNYEKLLITKESQNSSTKTVCFCSALWCATVSNQLTASGGTSP